MLAYHFVLSVIFDPCVAARFAEVAFATLFFQYLLGGNAMKDMRCYGISFLYRALLRGTLMLVRTEGNERFLDSV